VKSLVIEVSIDGVSEEQTREEQDLGAEEQPHAEAHGAVLLGLRFEVMRQMRLAAAGSSMGGVRFR
jgi:hypothetical protein